MEHILEVHGLRKKYAGSGFELRDVSFSLPYGSIMGFVGENGAGKTTTISAILNTIKKDGGRVRIFGRPMEDGAVDIREAIGVVFDAVNFSESLTPLQLGRVMGQLYRNWEPEKYRAFLAKLQLPPEKKIKSFSRGMTMKLALAAALSHKPKLLILDEATAGLDPIVREEILDLFLEFIGDERHSILLSSHITGDLEKVADYLTFIHKGKTLLTIKKDDLLYGYGILRCGREAFHTVDRKDMLAYRRRDYQVDILVPDKHACRKKYAAMAVDNITIDEAMLLLIKGEKL